MAGYKKFRRLFVLKLIALVCLTGIHSAQAQYRFERINTVPVSENNKVFKYPWLGGLNNPQFSAVDLNNNGIKDLVIFDKTGNYLMTFINNGTPGKVDYVYAPEYREGFPPLRFWLLMDDFNCDGIEDIYTSLPARINYYTGRYEGGKLTFDSVGVFLYSGANDTFPIFVTDADIPAIVDVNGDGDVDVLTFQSQGGVVEYFENQSMESTGSCAGTLVFDRTDHCWGDFYETAFNNAVLLDSCGGFLNDTCSFSGKRSHGNHHSHNSHNSTGGPRHAGSTLLAFDEDGDGDMDLILGDISFNRLNRLINGGDAGCALIVDQDPAFPSYDISYDVPVFPASFYVDVNNDGLKDLIVAPNQQRASENFKCVWMYENIGTADSVVFSYRMDTFIVGGCLDFGEGAYPAFFDHNGDGLMDLVVGNYGYYVNGVVYHTALALLENVGTAVAPAFKLVDRDYAGASSLAKLALNPAFGDMDNDGDMDMILGGFDGFLHYFENTGVAGGPANFVLKEPNYKNIDPGQFSSPFIYDVNGDQLPDLIVGEKSGNLNYYENTGTPSTPDFDSNPTNSFFGKIDVRVLGLIDGYSKPVITRLDSTDNIYVLSGSDEGKIRGYLFDRDSIYQGSFTKVFNAYSDINEGIRIGLTVADLNQDGKLEMVVGNYRGGVSFFSQSDEIAISVHDLKQHDQFVLNIYPNPSDHYINIEISGPALHKQAVVEIIDLPGKTLLRKSFVTTGSPVTTRLDIQGLASGIYFCAVRNGSQVSVKKFIIQ